MHRHQGWLRTARCAGNLAGYYALWTLALWVLFGVYVTVLWVVACCFYLPSRLMGRPSTILPRLAEPTEEEARVVTSRLPSETASAAQPANWSSDVSKIRRVAVIGAGASGLATARVLLAQGLDCSVFERRPSLGGVWANGYLNFGVQTQRELYEFPDWPLPADTANFTPGPVFQRYLTDYATLQALPYPFQHPYGIAETRRGGMAPDLSRRDGRQDRGLPTVVAAINLARK
jgi:hypothetical protein